jgi:endoplasmic reticulum Man9GlcNAc2 1,2-alpha-mannosidase
VQTTIRVLGGLLSAHHLSSHDPVFLERAKELADRILPAFNTPSELPLPSVNLAKQEGIPDDQYPALVSTAEIATLQLEFRYLSLLTGDEIYWTKVEKVRVSY